jgi:hypothetical protein
VIQKIKFLRGIWVVGLVAALFPFATQAATKEDAVKAGFVYNFTKFITWPTHATPQTNFNLCVVGDDQLDGSLEALYGKLIGDKPLILQRNPADEALKDCHLVFVADDAKQNIQEVLQKFNGLPAATVSDSPDFIQKGGMIGLIRDGNRVGFEINLAPANAAGLRISSQLLKLAKHVKGLK